MMKKQKCDYIGCNEEATTAEVIYGHVRGSKDKDNFIEVNSCDKHAKSDGFFPRH